MDHKQITAVVQYDSDAKDKPAPDSVHQSSATSESKFNDHDYTSWRFLRPPTDQELDSGVGSVGVSKSGSLDIKDTSEVMQRGQLNPSAELDKLGTRRDSGLGIVGDSRSDSLDYNDMPMKVRSTDSKLLSPPAVLHQMGISGESDSGYVSRSGTIDIKENNYQQKYAYNLPEPSTAMKLHQCRLISGNKMLYAWDKSPELTLISSLKLAGQVHSLDTWKGFIAVGSSVVQVIKLNPIGDPTRTLYIKGENNLLHSGSSSTHFLITFVGDSGDLASAMVGGNMVDIWSIPQTDSTSEIVMRPKSSIALDDENIVSLRASKDPNDSQIVIATKANGRMKGFLLDWKSSSRYHFEIGEDHGICNIFLHLNGMHLIVGYGGNIAKVDAKTGRSIQSTTLDQTISCMNGSKGEFLVGTTGGDVIRFSEDDLTQRDRFNSTASVTAVAAEEDFSSVYIAYSNGSLKVWSIGDQVNDIHDSVPEIQNEEEQALNFDCVLGQQLCSEGILTQRQIFHPSPQESLSYPFEKNGVSIELPPEILKHPNPMFEAAFSPFGPVGTQFILPEKMIPVSSAVWLCVSPYEKFRSPATLELSHCFTCNSSEDSKLLHFLKAEHKDIRRDEFGNLTITFEEVDPTQSEFLPQKQTGTLKDHHFCIYCLAAVSEEKEVLGKINYCLTILKPKCCPTKERTKIYCILHFDLKGCKKLVEEQTPKDYDTVTKYLQFKTGRFESALEIHLDKAAAEKCGWVITIESEKEIFAEDVNFYNYRKVDYLEAACKTSDVSKPYPHAYPPRFVLEVSARYAKHHSIIDLTFTGARRDLYTQIQLEPLRCEDDLNEVNGPRNPAGGDDAWRPTEQSSPLPFPNGNCGPETDIDVH